VHIQSTRPPPKHDARADADREIMKKESSSMSEGYGRHVS